MGLEVIIGAIGVILVLFILGMLFRKKGDGVLDTMGAGCRSFLVLAILSVSAIAVIIYFSNK